ncbi:hypothetical protein D918_02244 [Trichuris suis]|nr:hypothetical protein D918_02244 [Trichuris suis]
MALQPLQENAKIVTLSRRNLLVQERRLPVRRRLFSRADDTESQSDLKSSTDLWLARHLDNMRLQLRQASYKWGYDFEADRPNPVADCEFVWTAVPANQVPLPYRTCGPAAKEPKVRTDQSTLNTSSTPTVPCPGRKRPRQTSLNEFFAVSKQSPNEPSGGAYTSYTSFYSRQKAAVALVKHVTCDTISPECLDNVHPFL